MEALKHMVIL